VSLVLPANGSAPERLVEGEAVVVRAAPAAPGKTGGPYRLALFFSHLEEDGRRALAGFLAGEPGRQGR
jgi:hypothetical protein